MKQGDRLSRFTILEDLGHGGMGGVFVGFDADKQQLVAIKTLNEEFSNDEGYVRRFQREAALYRKLNHPNIVGFVEAGFDEGTYFIAMEHIKGKSLDEILKSNGRLPVEQAVKIMALLVDAVLYAHSHAVIHRDVKPQNIMVSETGEIKLLDFGVASAEDDLVKTQTGSILGTFFYASPEQNQGKKIDERSDLYSLGLVFYEMVVGQRALAGATVLEVTANQMRGQIARPREIVPDLPQELEDTIMKLLERDPADRFQSAADVRGAIQRLQAPVGGGEIAPQASSPEVSLEHSEEWAAAREAFAARHLDEALEIALEVSKRHGDSPEVHCLLGKIYASKEFTYNAIEEFKQTLTLAPKNVQYMQDYAIALYSMRMYDRAKEEFENILAIDPDNVYVQRYLQFITQTPSASVLPSSPSSPSSSPSSPSSLPPPGTPPPPAPAVAPPPPGPPDKQKELADQFSFQGFGPAAGAQPLHPNRSEGARIPEVDRRLAQLGEVLSAPPAPAGERVATPPVAPPPPGSVVGPPPLPGGGVGPPPIPGGSVGPPPVPVGLAPRPPSPAGGYGASIPPPLAGSSYGVAPPPPTAGPGYGTSPAPPAPRPAAYTPPPGDFLNMGAAPGVPSYFAPPRPGGAAAAPSYSPPLPSGSAVDAVLGGSGPDPSSGRRTAPFRVEQVYERDELEVGQPMAERFKKKKRDASPEDLRPPLDPGKARFLSYIWWGAGHWYNGLSTKGTVVSILELVLIAMIVFPFTPYWQNVDVDFGNWSAFLVEQGLPGNGFPCETLSDWSDSGYDRKLNAFCKEYLHAFVIAFGAFIFLVYEMRVPAEVHAYAVLTNLTGKVVEVRQDLSVKINLGEDRGVKIGHVFAVQKRKHIDQVSGLDFKTMMMVPKLFTIGEAKVVSTTPHFAICKFRRLPGETSSPSGGDKVVLKKGA